MSQVLISSEKVYKVLGFTDSMTECGCCGKTDLKGTYVMEHIESGEINYFGCVCAAKHKGYTKKEFTTEAKLKIRETIKVARSEFYNSEENKNYNQTVAKFHETQHEWEEIKDAMINIFSPLSKIADAKRAEIAAKYFLKTNRLY